jgi:hypothetical protein
LCSVSVYVGGKEGVTHTRIYARARKHARTHARTQALVLCFAVVPSLESACPMTTTTCAVRSALYTLLSLWPTPPGKYMNVMPTSVPPGFDAWMANEGGNYIAPSFQMMNITNLIPGMVTDGKQDCWLGGNHTTDPGYGCFQGTTDASNYRCVCVCAFVFVLGLLTPMSRSPGLAWRVSCWWFSSGGGMQPLGCSCPWPCGGGAGHSGGGAGRAGGAGCWMLVVWGGAGAGGAGGGCDFGKCVHSLIAVVGIVRCAAALFATVRPLRRHAIALL